MKLQTFMSVYLHLHVCIFVSHKTSFKVEYGRVTNSGISNGNSWIIISAAMKHLGKICEHYEAQIETKLELLLCSISTLLIDIRNFIRTYL